MKTKKYFSYILVAFALILVGVKFRQGKEPIAQPNQHDSTALDPHGSARLVPTNSNKKVINSPLGKVNVAEILPNYELYTHLNQKKWIDEMSVNSLSQMTHLPWKVYLDENKHVVKLQARNVDQPVVSDYKKMLTHMENHGFVIKGIGHNIINFNDDASLQSLAKFLVKENFFSMAAQSKYADSMLEIEFYPVTANYVGNWGNEEYIGDKELPMMLIKKNKGYPRQEYPLADEWDPICQKYGYDQCRIVVWELLPFPRNEKEAEWFNNAPNPQGIGTGMLMAVPFVSAWEKVHGEKYVEK